MLARACGSGHPERQAVKAVKARPEPAPENAAFVRRARVEQQEEPHPLVFTRPVEDVPRPDVDNRRSAPEPVEEKPIVSFDPPRGEPFVHARSSSELNEAPITMRRHGAVYRTSRRFSSRRPEF
jgi:hypothetical protein